MVLIASYAKPRKTNRNLGKPYVSSCFAIVCYLFDIFYFIFSSAHISLRGSDLAHLPREYFSKWGDSYLAAIETSVENSSIGDLWKFWYETEPKEPLKEWEEPIHAINWQFALTFYAFSGGGLVIALAGLFMIIHAVKKR